MSQYDIGDVGRCSVAFRDIAGASVDPDQVILQIKRPDESIVQFRYNQDAALIRDSVGEYHLDYLITQDGTHYYKWSGTGNVYAAEESQFFVKRTQF
jgi:hypothetical protein